MFRSPHRGLRAILTGNSCVLCGQNRTMDKFCTECALDLPRIRFSCRRCAMPLPGASDVELGCGRCQQQPPVFEFVVAPMEYAFPVNGMLKALKFRRQQFFAPALGELLISALEGKLGEVDAILPVPLHRWRHFRRGFNQATEIARPLARRYGLPLITSVNRCRATLPQSGLSTAARNANLRKAFAADRSLTCRYPLIVDDVITTGSTINQLADVLLAAGAQRVAAVAVARAVLGG